MQEEGSADTTGRAAAAPEAGLTCMLTRVALALLTLLSVHLTDPSGVMATKLYLRGNLVGEASEASRPPDLNATFTKQGGWLFTLPSHFSLSATKFQDPGWHTRDVSNQTAVGGTKVPFGHFISPPLDSDQTITGTLDLIAAVSESNAAANFYWRVHAWVRKPDDTVRGTLLSAYEENTTNEFPTTATVIQLQSPQALSSVSALKGDRIIVEIGYIARNTANVLYQGKFYIGTSEYDAPNTLLSDATPGGTPGTGSGDSFASYLAFSQTITFDESHDFVASGATVISSLPYDASKTSADLDAAWPYESWYATASQPEVWFKYTPGANGVIGFSGFAAPAYPTGNYQVVSGIYTGTPGLLTAILEEAPPKLGAVTVNAVSGTDYYIQFKQNQSAVTPLTAGLDVHAEAAGTSFTPPYIVVNDDTDAFPAIVIGTNGVVQGFLPDTTIAAGENGAVLTSGISAWAKLSDGVIYLADSANALITTVDLGYGGGGGGASLRQQFASNKIDLFYVARVLPLAAAKVSTVTDTGTVDFEAWTLPVDSTNLQAVAVSRDDTILYYAEYTTDDAIHRYDLIGDAPLSDLLANPNAGYRWATTPNNHPGDLLVMSDGTLVIKQRQTGGDGEKLLHIAADGTVINTWTYDVGVDGVIDHLAIPTGADGPDSIWIWRYKTDVPDANTAIFQQFTLSTGVVVDSFELPMFAKGIAAGSGNTGVFGPSSSCLFVSRGAATGTINVVKATVPPASTQAFEFTAGGELSPATFDLLDGETQAFTDLVSRDGYSITETPVAGWSTSYAVSNGSPPDNIAVGPGETVTVTVTNTQAPPPVPPPEPPGPCCATSGPGGGPPGGTDPPRVVPPGGAPPEYITCNAGGGLPEFAEDPADLSDLATCTVPRVYLQWRLRDSSVLRLGEFGFTSHRGPVTARVTSWGPVKQVLADRFGAFQANHFTVRLSDTDRAIRALLTSAATKYIDGTEIEILIEADGGAPRVLARAVVSDYSFNADLSIDLTCTDPLGYKYSSVSLDRPLPRRTLRRELFPTLPEESSGKPAPVIYGIYSDDYTWLLNPNRIPVGICPIHYVGAPSSIPGLEGAPGDHTFAIAGHALSCVQSVFASNLGKDVDGETDVPYGSVRMPTSLFGAEFFVPGIDLPLYHDITGSDGITERFAFLTVAEGPRVRDHLNGRVPITINPLGIEDVGDGSGNTITSLTYQFLHFLCQWVLQDYRSGAWLPVPRFADGTPKVRTSSFQDVVDIQTARIGAPYEGAMYLGEHKPGRAWNTAWQVSGDMRHGVNHQGQSLVTTLNDTGDTDTLTAFTDVDHVVDASFTVEPKPEEIANIFTYDAGPEAATKRVGVVAKTIRNLTSIANHDEREAQALTYEATRHPLTADDVANRTLVRTADAPTEVFFATNLRAAALQLGQLIRMKHYQGIGPFGWTDRVLLVTGVQTMPDADQFACEVECEDVHDILAAGQDVFVIDEALIDDARIG